MGWNGVTLLSNTLGVRQLLQAALRRALKSTLKTIPPVSESWLSGAIRTAIKEYKAQILYH